MMKSQYMDEKEKKMRALKATNKSTIVRAGYTSPVHTIHLYNLQLPQGKTERREKQSAATPVGFLPLPGQVGPRSSGLATWPS